MKVLINGAFGNLGLMCVEKALDLGFELRCFDLDTKDNRRRAAAYEGRVDAIFGDICNPDLHVQLLEDIDAVIHNAALLPPATESNPLLAREVNVKACTRLIDVAERSEKKPVFVFPSSVTVFGVAKIGELPLTVEDPVMATDVYTENKISVEDYLKRSSIPWVILRVGVSVDERTLGTDRKTFKSLLEVRADNPLEYVHPKDVALAMCRACMVSEARHKVLLIGGGESCQITQHQFLSAALAAVGLRLPASIHGDKFFYTHWMNTCESQRLLGFQQHDFYQYKLQMKEKLKWLRLLIRPFSFLINPILPRVFRLL